LLRKQRKTLGGYFFLPHPVYGNFFLGFILKLDLFIHLGHCELAKKSRCIHRNVSDIKLRQKCRFLRGRRKRRITGLYLSVCPSSCPYGLLTEKRKDIDKPKILQTFLGVPFYESKSRTAAYM